MKMSKYVYKVLAFRFWPPLISVMPNSALSLKRTCKVWVFLEMPSNKRDLAIGVTAINDTVNFRKSQDKMLSQSNRTSSTYIIIFSLYNRGPLPSRLL